MKGSVRGEANSTTGSTHIWERHRSALALLKIKLAAMKFPEKIKHHSIQQFVQQLAGAATLTGISTSPLWLQVWQHLDKSYLYISVSLFGTMCSILLVFMLWIICPLSPWGIVDFMSFRPQEQKDVQNLAILMKRQENSFWRNERVECQKGKRFQLSDLTRSGFYFKIGGGLE